MVRLGRRQSSSEASEGWTVTPAEIRDVKYGLVHTTSTGVDAMYDHHAASKKLSVQVEPPGGQPYEATLKIDRDGPTTPDVPGTRLDVLVDPSDPQNLALPADPTFTLPGGQTWRPEHGLAGAIAEASKRGDAQELARLTAEARAASAAPQASGAGPTRGTEDDTLGQLEKLGKLHESGVLNDEEFNEQKAKILGRS